MFYFIHRKPAINTLLRFYSLAKKCHYDVLKLRKNCTDKEIKEAFIKMSKEYHPDKNKDVNAQKNFVRIVEAYNVIGKPSSRAQYDRLTDTEQNVSSHNWREAYNFRSGPAYNFYTENQKQYNQRAEHQSHNRNHSGKRVPNYIIILFCIGVAFVGTMLQVIVIRELYVVHRKQAQEKSKYLAEELEKVRSAAQGNGNEMQTRILLEKIVASANPTIATASLGQALANEEK